MMDSIMLVKIKKMSLFSTAGSLLILGCCLVLFLQCRSASPASPADATPANASPANNPSNSDNIVVNGGSDQGSGMVLFGRNYWQKCARGQTPTGEGCDQSAQSTTYRHAELYCGNLNASGKKWRLPTKDELMELVITIDAEPKIDTKLFPGTRPYGYWSSTPYRDSGTSSWYVDFRTGLSLGELKTKLLFVRCISEGI